MSNAWQDIETAPTGIDGLQVLVVIGHHKQIRVAWWQMDNSGLNGRWLTIGGLPIKPTHWMPLPAPPSAGQETNS